MTARKHLKQLVRERQEKTGERYATALAHVRAKARRRVPEQSLPEVTRQARLEGLHCQAFVTEHLLRSERAVSSPGKRFRVVFARLRELLEALEGEPAAEALRAAVLRGEPRFGSIPNGIQEVVELRRFVAQARAGVRGISRNGRYLTFDVPRDEAQLTLCAFCMLPMAGSGGSRVPILWIFSQEGLADALLGGLGSGQAFALTGLGGLERGTP